MKTSHQKYRRSHWWKFTDWDNVMMSAVLIALLGFMIFGLVWAITHPGHDDSDKADSVTDSIADSVAVDSIPDSTLIVDSVPTKSEEETKSDPAVFDTTVENTRIVIKTNRPIRVVVK